MTTPAAAGPGGSVPAALSDAAQLLRVLPEPSFLVAGSGQILMANSAAGDLVGLQASALSGADLASLTADPPERVRSYLALCSRTRQLVPGSLTWKLKSGTSAEVRCDAAALLARTQAEPAVLFLRCRPKAEATDHFVLLNQKITALSKEIVERKKAEQQRDQSLASERAARIEAEKHSRMKDEFLATLSHELRTPLNAILGWSQVLRRAAGLPADAAQGLEVIERNARAQTQLIEDLLDMNRIITGKVRLDVQRVDLSEVIGAAVESVRPAADAKGIRLQQTLDPSAGPVKGDSTRLQQVVWNLLTNSVRFTPKGGRVQVFLERANSHVELTVSDTGEGIRPEFLPHVFDRFRQADAGSTRRHNGLGLGLSIVKQLVELHGGTVRAKSPGEGKGATFVVTLPVLVLHEPEEPSAASPAAGAARSEGDPCAALMLRGVKVLVVDDEPDARELVKVLLENCEAQVSTAGSVDEAMPLLESFRPRVLLSDIGMPVHDGYELIRRVRALPTERGGRTPAVALTAFARSEDRTRAMLAGFQVHLSKPIEAPELIATVGSLAGRTGQA